MSDPVRIGLAVEGPTDFAVLGAIIGHLLQGRQFVLTPLQPELSEAFTPQGGGGWAGVLLWCQSASAQAGGQVRHNPLYLFHDVLIVQIDADVAGMSYSSDRRIRVDRGDLPCEQPCPPASATTDVLRSVVLGWMGETSIPDATVLCIPSKAIETWVLVGLFPEDEAVNRPDLECRMGMKAKLQSKPTDKRLVRGGKSDVDAYRQYADELAHAWPRIRSTCSEAERFSNDLLAVIS